jgi:hypothetical protein
VNRIAEDVVAGLADLGKPFKYAGASVGAEGAGTHSSLP